MGEQTRCRKTVWASQPLNNPQRPISSSSSALFMLDVCQSITLKVKSPVVPPCFRMDGVFTLRHRNAKVRNVHEAGAVRLQVLHGPDRQAVSGASVTLPARWACRLSVPDPLHFLQGGPVGFLFLTRYIPARWACRLSVPDPLHFLQGGPVGFLFLTRYIPAR